MPPSSWLALVPPVAVVLSTIIIRQIHLSLAIGILSAALVAAQGLPLEAFSIGSTALWNTITNVDNLYLYGFLLGIAFLVSLLTITGFARSFAQAIARHIHSAKAATYTTMLVSFLMLIDDYLTILASGYVMGPLIDQFGIAREKFAFLIHSFAGPLVILIPISSWVATIMAYMMQAGIETTPTPGIPLRIAAEPFFIYLKAIPFMLYSILILIAVWFIVYYQISFGPMQRCEENAIIKAPSVPVPSIEPTMRYLLVPLITLVVSIAVGLPWAGGYHLFGGKYTFIESIKYNQHPFLVMLLAILGTIAITIFQGLYKGVFSRKLIRPILEESYHIMVNPITMVFLASTLSGLLANKVGTGHYIAHLLMDLVPLALLPMMLFIVSLICAIATGSAWSNFALMLPISIPMLTTLSGLPLPIDPHDLPLLLPTLGAIFSGSVCGDQISPLSDTTTMIVRSTSTTIKTHTYTQIFYILPLIGSCIIGYTVMGLLIGQVEAWINAIISCAISCTIGLALLWLLNYKKKKLI